MSSIQANSQQKPNQKTQNDQYTNQSSPPSNPSGNTTAPQQPAGTKEDAGRHAKGGMKGDVSIDDDRDTRVS